VPLLASAVWPSASDVWLVLSAVWRVLFGPQAQEGRSPVASQSRAHTPNDLIPLAADCLRLGARLSVALGQAARPV